MINEKMMALGNMRSEIRELYEYGLRRKAEIGEENVFDFSLGNPSVPCPDDVSSALCELVQSQDPIRLHGYTSAAGDASVRETIARHITNTHGFKVSGSDLYMTVGAAAALTCALTALVKEGEEVIVLTPYFPEYRVFIERFGGVVREVECSPTSFYPDVAGIEAAINERTAAIIVNSPNNPSGAVYPENILRELADALLRAEKKHKRDIYLISDEPYRELVYDGQDVPFIPSIYDNTVVCYSYSKSLSLPGERIGYCLVSPRVRAREDVYHAICGAGRALGYVCAPSMLQMLLPKCLGLTSDVSVYDKNRRLLYDELTKYGYSVVKPQGAFYLFVKSPVGSARKFSEMAKKHELLIVPSDSFGYPGYVRISYPVKTEIIERALPAFRELAREAGLSAEN